MPAIPRSVSGAVPAWPQRLPLIPESLRLPARCEKYRRMRHSVFYHCALGEHFQLYGLSFRPKNAVFPPAFGRTTGKKTFLLAAKSVFFPSDSPIFPKTRRMGGAWGNGLIGCSFKL